MIDFINCQEMKKAITCNNSATICCYHNAVNQKSKFENGKGGRK